jgi:hypothetical protein
MDSGHIPDQFPEVVHVMVGLTFNLVTINRMYRERNGVRVHFNLGGGNRPGFQGFVLVLLVLVRIPSPAKTERKTAE